MSVPLEAIEIVQFSDVLCYGGVGGGAVDAFMRAVGGKIGQVKSASAPGVGEDGARALGSRTKRPFSMAFTEEEWDGVVKGRRS